MNDDFGRGQLNWSVERWAELDALAADAVAENVVLRNLVDHREDAGAFSARIGGGNVNVHPIQSNDFEFDMAIEDEEDLERRIRLAAQELALEEDRAVLAVLAAGAVQTPAVDFPSFSRAKAALPLVRRGYAAVASSAAISNLETSAMGVKSHLEATEQLLATKLLRLDALDDQPVSAVVLQASPPAYRLVHGALPKPRVIGVQNGRVVTMRLEATVAAGLLEAGRACVIELAVGRAQAGEGRRGPRHEQQES